MIRMILTHKVDKSLYAGIIYAKSVYNSATESNDYLTFIYRK
jgi:hypothetical protein